MVAAAKSPSVTALRRSYRRQRRALSRADQDSHARAASRHVFESGLLLSGRAFAIYAAADGELDTAPLIDRMLAAHRIVALPVVQTYRAMDFYRVTQKTPLVQNRYGIPEPNALVARYLAPLAIDIVFAPLVAFDASGHRLGMGGGYYDRFLNRRGRRPLIVGLAHALQQADTLPRESWDVPLDAVVTETGFTAFSARARRFGRRRERA